MTNPVIPAEAVEAAAKKFASILANTKWEHLGPLTQDAYRDHARAALESAAPYMLADAWDEGYDDAVDAFDGRNVSNPYRTHDAR